ncbi:MAG TPA: thioesterase family protein [Kofleriaceae bacterium]|nr:thioesterase family protein [Kofleriaceae bacterium]
MSLAAVTFPTRTSDGYRLEVAAGWRQGRGAYGGLVVASMVRAIEARIADPARKLRSLTAELPGPLETGSADLAVDVLRAGSSVTTARAAISQRGEVKAHAVAVLGATRKASDGVGWQDLVPPQAPGWREVAPTPFTAPFPEFAQHFEYRVIEGIPMSGAAARTLGWIRPRERGVLSEAAFLAGTIDAWFPAVLVRLPQMRPIGTIAYTLEIVGSLEGLDPDAPLLYRATVPVLAEGYFLETRELWGEDGRLLALNHQTFAVIA